MGAYIWGTMTAALLLHGLVPPLGMAVFSLCYAKSVVSVVSGFSVCYEQILVSVVSIFSLCYVQSSVYVMCSLKSVLCADFNESYV